MTDDILIMVSCQHDQLLSDSREMKKCQVSKWFLGN